MGQSPDALVERVRSEVGAAGPDDRPAFAIGGDRSEPSQRDGLLEHRAVHAVQDIDLAGEAISER